MKRAMFIVCTVCAGFMMLTSCEKEGEGGNEANTSFTGSAESHNMGQNCMNCHQRGGEGEGWFNVAGTIYNEANNKPVSNGRVELYTGPNGTGNLAYTFEVDSKGNFYTTENVNFGNGLYAASVVSQSRRFMPDPVTTGQCNSCHGDSTHKIWGN
jgi:cytochrome c553